MPPRRFGITVVTNPLLRPSDVEQRSFATHLASIGDGASDQLYRAFARPRA